MTSAIDPSDRCEWDDCTAAWMACVTVGWAKSLGREPDHDYWLCTHHTEELLTHLELHHQPRITEDEQPAPPDPPGTVVMTCGPYGCRVQRVGES